MESYLRRIASFNKSQIPQPVADDVPLLSFARSGFYLTSNQKIKTFCCDKELVSLATNETPREAHRRLSPNCTFIQRPNNLSRESARKYGMGKTQTSPYNAIVKSCKSSLPSVSSYAASNETNLPTQHVRLPDETVRTPSDNAAITSWINENRQSPTRDFLSLMKQEIRRLETFHDFPSDCPMSRQSLAEAGFFYLGTKDRVQCAFCRGVLRNWDPDDEPRREHAKSLTGCDFIHGKDVGNVPLVQPRTQRTQIVHFNPEERGTGRADPASPEETSQNSKAKADDSKMCSTEEAASLAAQIASFREARLCKVCLDEEVNTVFLPCGHLVSCDSCAPKLNSCPICRHIIRGTVLAFL